MTRHRWRAAGRSAVVRAASLGLLVATAALAPSATAASAGPTRAVASPVPAPPVSLDGDGLAPPPPGRPSLVPRPEVAGAGFNTFEAGAGYVLRNADAMTVRLVATGEGNVEALRGAVQSVAQQVGAISGVSLTVAPGTVADTVPDREPGTDEILISLDSTSPCGSGDWWAGCGGPRIITDSPRAGIRVIHGGRAWIHPQAMGYSAADLGHVVSHELGHTLGLDHYDGVFEGTTQVMHSGSYAAGAGFRSGDANGLRQLSAPLPPQGPANDGFEAAHELAGSSGSVRGSNVGATKQSREPAHADTAGGASVWYRWRAPVTGSVAVSTRLSGFDTVLAVYRGRSIGGLTPVAANDDFAGTLQSRVIFTARAGVNYRIAVDGYGGRSGSLRLGYRPR